MGRDDGGSCSASQVEEAVMVAAIRMEGLARSLRATVAPLDLEVAGGEVLGCLAPDGAGTSMTFRCLLGMPGGALAGGRAREASDGVDGRGTGAC